MKTALIFVLCLSPIWAISRGNTKPFISHTFIISKTLGARIIGGQDSYAGEFPYAAAIYKSTAEGNYFCTGSVLNKEWIITAGQCVDG